MPRTRNPYPAEFREQIVALARMAVFQFIEGWYNPARRHSALGYLSLTNYERSANGRLESVSP